MEEKKMNNLTEEQKSKLIEILEQLKEDREEKPKRKKYGKVPTPFSAKQLRALFANCTNAKQAMACLLALRTGMRIAETFSTKITDIRWELKQIRKEKTKGDKPRVYLLDDEFIKILRKWTLLLGDTEYLFPSDTLRKSHVKSEGFAREFRKILARAGLLVKDPNRPNGKLQHHLYSFHTFRTTFICLLLNKGISPYFVKELAGHSKLDTTMRHYAAAGFPSLRDALAEVFSGKKTKLPKPEKMEYPELRQEMQKPQTATQEAYLPDPLQQLEIQLARGEITIEEFNNRYNAIVQMRGTSNFAREERPSYVG